MYPKSFLKSVALFHLVFCSLCFGKDPTPCTIQDMTFPNLWILNPEKVRILNDQGEEELPSPEMIKMISDATEEAIQSPIIQKTCSLCLENKEKFNFNLSFGESDTGTLFIDPSVTEFKKSFSEENASAKRKNFFFAIPRVANAVFWMVVTLGYESTSITYSKSKNRYYDDVKVMIPQNPGWAALEIANTPPYDIFTRTYIVQNRKDTLVDFIVHAGAENAGCEKAFIRRGKIGITKTKAVTVQRHETQFIDP